jgi:hypothetical protein
VSNLNGALTFLILDIEKLLHYAIYFLLYTIEVGFMCLVFLSFSLYA